MVSFSFPLIFSSISVVTNLYIDRLAIISLLDLEKLGIYGMAYRFASISNLLIFGFQNSLMPLVYKHINERNTPNEISKIFNYFSFFAFVLILMSILYSKEIIILFTTEEFFAASDIIPLLVISIIFSNMYIFAPGIFIAKKTKLVAIVFIIGALVNALLNYFLIPLIGLFGACISTIISAFISTLVLFIISAKYYKIPYQFRKLIVSLILSVCFAYLFIFLFHGISILFIVLKFLSVIVIAVLLWFQLIKSISGSSLIYCVIPPDK